MPERSTIGKRVAAAAAVAACMLLVGTTVALGAGAWDASNFDPPFAGATASVSTDTFAVSGTFVWEKPTPTSEVTGAVVGVADDDTDGYELREGCRIPAPTAFQSDGTRPEEPTDELAFNLAALHLNCNGRYLLRATASTDHDADPSHTMTRSVVVAAPPRSVSDVSASVTDETGEVAVGWQLLTEEELAIDASGYVLQRSGPAVEGSFGDYVTIATFGLDATGAAGDTLVDGGSYRYRIRPTRDGVEGAVLANVLTTPVAEITYDPPPPTTTTTTTTTTAPTTTESDPQIGTAAPSQPRRRPTPTFVVPTTVDTGFEETLDYTRPTRAETTTTDSIELAGEDPFAGQSIVRDEAEEDLDLVVPVAGALVMLGWAGHLLYLNRLAKQL